MEINNVRAYEKSFKYEGSDRTKIIEWFKENRKIKEDDRLYEHISRNEGERILKYIKESGRFKSDRFKFEDGFCISKKWASINLNGSWGYFNYLGTKGIKLFKPAGIYTPGLAGLIIKGRYILISLRGNTFIKLNSD